MQTFGDTDNLVMDWERKITTAHFVPEYGGSWMPYTEGRVGMDVWNSKCWFWDILLSDAF